MGIEGMWAVYFQSNMEDYGGGVVIFETNRLFGGDSSYYYTGSYNAEAAKKFRIAVTVKHFHGEPRSIFGPIDEMDLDLVALMTEDGIVAEGSVRGDPTRQVRCNLRWLADLP